jgi:hypothetical protein
MAKIFVRERRDVSEGTGRPRFAIVGVQGADLKFFKEHVRKVELDAIAEAVGADVVVLPWGQGEHEHEPRGTRRRRNSQRQGAE